MSEGSSFVKSSVTVQGDVAQGRLLAAAAALMLPMQGKGTTTGEAVEGNSP